MVYSKTRQRVALTLVATFAFAAVGTARADDTSDLKAKFEALQKQLDAVKAQVRMLAAEVRAETLRRDAGMPDRVPSRHLIFTGQPGTSGGPAIASICHTGRHPEPHATRT